jgi:DNA repair photolyase
MKRTTTIILNPHASKALNCQKHFDNFGFPFTLNPTIGCSFACKYCYSPIFVAKVATGKRKQFFEEIKIKMDIPTLLERELTKLSILPQHLKRVQINETSDYYLPRVIKELNKQGRDIMLEILEVFQNQSTRGNTWMLHILSKSNLVLNHLDKFKEMKEMVQLEISFCTHDDDIRKQFEFFTISTNERIKVVETLAKNDIFVRIMAMPFYGESKDLKILKDMTFSAGAKAFKNKGLNYFKWDELKNLSYEDLIDDKITRISSRMDNKKLDVMVKSGEEHLIENSTHSVNLVMPPRGKGKFPDWSVASKISERLTDTNMNVIDCGYSAISKLNWGYIL